MRLKKDLNQLAQVFLDGSRFIDQKMGDFGFQYSSSLKRKSSFRG